MKPRFLLIALAFVATAVTAMAQVASPIAPLTLPEPPSSLNRYEPVPSSISPLEFQDYGYLAHHFRRIGPDANGDPTDSNRTVMVFPTPLGPTLELRGIGELFVPHLIYNYYRGLATQYDTSHLALQPAAYEQFRNARAYTIQIIRSYLYRNPNGSTPEWPLTFTVLQTPSTVPASYWTSTYPTRRGFAAGRAAMVTKFETEISPEGLDTTLNDQQINPTDMVFDPPLEFPAGSAAVALFINEAAQPVSDIQDNDPREFQLMAAWWNRPWGAKHGFQMYKNMGQIVYRNIATQQDTILASTYLSFNGADSAITALLDPWMIFVGTVDLNAGIKYHFGEDTQAQGLRAPTPNPVSDDSRIPFSLVTSSQVALDLFDATGRHIRTIVRDQYVPGNYSAPLDAADLPNGTYVVRMVTRDNVYTMKVNVAH